MCLWTESSCEFTHAAISFQFSSLFVACILEILSDQDHLVFEICGSPILAVAITTGETLNTVDFISLQSIQTTVLHK